MRKPKPLTPEQGVTYALRLLNQRNYSTHMLKTKLLWRGLTDAEADAIVRKLTDLNLLNDARYAESLLRDETEFRHKSQRYVKQKLAAKGIEKEIIKETFAAIDDPHSHEHNNARYLAEKYVKKHPDALQTNSQKLIAHLASKGFDYAIIKRVIADLRQSSE